MRSRTRLVVLLGLLVVALSALAFVRVRRAGAVTVASDAQALVNVCSICGRQSVFVPAGNPPRPHAKCPVCGSLERHRMLALYLREKTPLFRDELSVLHFSPERGLSALLSARKNLRYATSWYEPDRPADYHLDLTALDLPDASWDAMICYHVFEHIPDDRAAMREMFRALKPGGFAVLQVPVREEPDTLEDPSVATDADRLRLYGKEDHVRYYGWQDFADRLTEAGFEVTIERFGHELPPELVRAAGLHRDERIYLARKPAAGAAGPPAS